MAQATQKPDKNSPEALMAKARSGRHALLLIILFTIINLVMVLLDSGTYFLFSASVPYYVTLMFKAWENGFSVGAWVNGPTTFAALVFSFVVLTVYFLCWLLSDKHRGWLIAALVLFIIDTIAMLYLNWLLYNWLLYESLLPNVVDLVFHIWAIAELFQAIRAQKKLWKLPFPEAEAIEDSPTGPEF